MTKSKIALVTLALLLSTGASTRPTIAASDDRWFVTYVNAHGGCGGLESRQGASPFLTNEVSTANAGFGYATPALIQSKIHGNFFGKPTIDWSDDDITAAVTIQKNCVANFIAAEINDCVRQTGAINRGPCERSALGLSEAGAKRSRYFEDQLRDVIMRVRNLDYQQKVQQTAKIQLANAEAQKKRDQAEKEAQLKQEQLREQARRDKEAAEEAARSAELRRAEAARAAAQAEKERNQRAIAKAIEDRQAAEEEAAREKHEAELRNAERKREVESMPLTATDIQLAVDKVGKFVTDYSARKIDASNVEARLEETTRAADEASRLIQTVKDHMTQDDDPATLDLENKVVALRPHLDELRAKIAGIPQEIAQEKAEKEKADRLAQEVAEEEADRQREEKEVGERHLAVNIMFDNVLYVLNDGEVTVRLSDIQINGRRECTQSATQNHAAWFNAANKLEDAERAHPIKLKVGESRRWLSPCRVIFSDITTYQGIRRYKSD